MLEMGTLGLRWRGLETGYGSASEALPEETGSQRIGRTSGVWRQSSTLLLGEAMETSASFVSSRQGCESCEVKVHTPPIACSRADSMSDACKGNDARSARM